MQLDLFWDFFIMANSSKLIYLLHVFNTADFLCQCFVNVLRFDDRRRRAAPSRWTETGVREVPGTWLSSFADFNVWWWCRTLFSITDENADVKTPFSLISWFYKALSTSPSPLGARCCWRGSEASCDERPVRFVSSGDPGFPPRPKRRRFTDEGKVEDDEVGVDQILMMSSVRTNNIRRLLSSETVWTTFTLGGIKSTT